MKKNITSLYFSKNYSQMRQSLLKSHINCVFLSICHYRHCRCPQVYVFLWFWFMLLAVITGVSIIFRLAAFQPIYDTEPFRYLCVQSHPLLMQTVNTNSFRIVPVCVPSVRKWGAYNMATIIDKFDFKFANRVTISFF